MTAQCILVPQISRVPAHEAKARQLLNWLVRREEAIGIAPRNPEQVHLQLTESQMRWVMLLTVVGLPLLAVVAGVAVWWRPRH